MQSALLGAMGERQVTVYATTMALPAPFFVLATLNPVELEETFPLLKAHLDRNLPLLKAHLDRFFLRFSVEYTDADEEMALLDRFRGIGGALNADPITLPVEILAPVPLLI
jgi:MoxR-like ATPase